MTTNAFVLKSVDLKNWKTFSEATLVVEEEGLTGIVGQNGAGKSSFVEAILWALYGARPEGVVKGDLRRRGIDMSKEPTSVKVTFTHAGQTIEVFRQMKGKNHTTTGTVFLDGSDVTRVTGGTVEAWVVNRLGMDASGFTTAIVVPQKELDAIVDMKPADRRKAIEKLAGIDEMNIAVQKAREQENELAKEIKVMPGSEEEIEEAETFLESVQDEMDTTSTQLADARAKESEASTELAAAVESGKGAKAKLDDAEVTHNKLESLGSKRALARQSASSLMERLEEARSEVGDVDVAKRAELLDEYRSVSAEMSSANTTFERNRQEHEAISRDISRTEASIAELVAKRDSTTLHLGKLDDGSVSDASIATDRESVNTVESRQSELSNARGRIQGRIADIEESISALSGVHQCPTCKSELADPESLTARFQKMVEDFRVELEENTAEASSGQERLIELRAKVEADSETLRRIGRGKEMLAEVEANIADAEDTLEALKKQLAVLPEVDESSHKTAMSTLEERQRAITVQGEAISRAIKAQERVDALSEEQEAAQKAVSDLEPEIAQLEEKLASFGDIAALDHRVAENEQLVETLRNEQRTAFSTMKDLESISGRLTERVSHAQERLEQQKAMFERKREGAKLLETRSSVTDLLDEYRKERIARIAPELSVTATDLISQMTNGRFIEVKMSDDFGTAVVKEDGNEYGVAELSGGEKSIVALALRIAIGSLITGDNSGLLWLDEVLPAQDAGRRDAVLSVLRDLPIQQVVMINHTHEAEDVVDRVVRVDYHEEGSTIHSETTIEEEAAANLSE